jgi:hypothetical protein
MALPSSNFSIENMLPNIKINGNIQIDYWNSWRVAQDYINDSRILDNYVVEEGVSWYDLSEAVYDERELWWVIPLFNEIENPFLMFTASSLNIKQKKLKVLKPEHLNQFLNEIRSFRLDKEREL